MKAYPKAEREVVCFECKKPILSRDDLFFTHNKKSTSKYKFVAIHTACYGKKLKRNPNVNPPINSTYVANSFKPMVTLASVMTLIGLVSILFANASITGLIIGIPFGILGVFAFVALYFSQKRLDYLWNAFEQYLPATCEQCTKTILPGRRICAACGWKYGQSAKKQKLKH